MSGIERYLKLSCERRTLPGLKAKFKGPKKQKASGKAAGGKKRHKESPESKSKTRQRNKKNQGKPKSVNKSNDSNDGFAPLKKKKSD